MGTICCYWLLRLPGKMSVLPLPRWTDFYEHAADEGPLQNQSNRRRDAFRRQWNCTLKVDWKMIQVSWKIMSIHLKWGALLGVVVMAIAYGISVSIQKKQRHKLGLSGTLSTQVPKYCSEMPIWEFKKRQEKALFPHTSILLLKKGLIRLGSLWGALEQISTSLCYNVVVPGIVYALTVVPRNLVISFPV